MNKADSLFFAQKSQFSLFYIKRSMAYLQSTCVLSSYHHHLCCISIRPIKNGRVDSPSKTSSKGCINTELIGQPVITKEKSISLSWSFLGGSKARSSPSFGGTNIRWRKSSAIYNSWISNAEIASKAFTLGTAAVLPFYTFMIVVPRAQMTKKLAESYIPYILLAILYAYLLYLSWTPDTFHLMFASKHWLPELTGIASLFSSKMTLASAWIHLLVVDLFAARQVYHEGLKDNIETRHSVSLCLFFCPIGILAHSITKATTRLNRERLNCH